MLHCENGRPIAESFESCASFAFTKHLLPTRLAEVPCWRCRLFLWLVDLGHNGDFHVQFFDRWLWYKACRFHIRNELFEGSILRQ